MHFTREPIIETVITPRDGYKLIVRNSVVGSPEEYSVDAVEVVAFGHAHFYRSMEKPRAFLLPVAEYEVVESKETRVVLKGISVDRSIKIGGGKEGGVRIQKEVAVARASSFVESEPNREEDGSGEQKLDRRRDRRRNRRRRPPEEREENSKGWTDSFVQKEGSVERTSAETEVGPLEGGEQSEEVSSTVSSPMFHSLIPPPATLISETIARYKSVSSVDGPLLSEKVTQDTRAKGAMHKHRASQEDLASPAHRPVPPSQGVEEDASR